MTKTVLQKFRPLFGICAGTCFATFMIVVVSCVIVCESIDCNYHVNSAWIFSALLLVLHLFIVIYSICKWNRRVFICKDVIIQHQWFKEIRIPYDEITNIRITRLSPIYPPVITIFHNKKHISFDVTKLDIFLLHCTNPIVIDKANALQRK